MYKITLLKTAHIDCADSVIYKNGSTKTTTPIGCHCFLLRKDGKYSLIDTGIESIDVVNKTKTSIADWTRSSNEHTVYEHLNNLGINCDEIERVFLTHAHYDHISAAKYFKNAKFYMTKTEYENFINDTTSSQGSVLGEIREFLTKDKVILFDDELHVDELTLKLRGGHTEGSMSIQIGDTIFAGDTIFVQNNLTEKIPAGYTVNREVSDALLNEYLTFTGKIVTSHDINEVI